MPGLLGRMTGWEYGAGASLLLLAGSLAFLAVAVIGYYGDGTPVDEPAATGTVQAIPTPTSAGPAKVHYATDVAVDLDPDSFQPVDFEDQPDITLTVASSPSLNEVTVRYFVPIVSPNTGVYEMALADLVVAYRPGANWSDLGGLAGPVTALSVPLADRALLSRWLERPDLPEPTYEDYGEIVQAVAAGTGVLAIVPLDYVNAAVTALAIDGDDIVSGRGDPASWSLRENVTVTAITARGASARASVVEAIEAALPDPITIVLTGDILQSRCTLERIRATGDWGAALRTPVGEFLAAADLALGSLDGSIQDIAPPWGCVRITNLSSPPETIEALTLAGFDGLTVATNHVFDCGQTYCGNRAFLRTLELLTEAGIKTWGGGRDLEEALAPGRFTVRGVTIGVLGFDDVAAYELEATESEPGTAPLDDSYAEERAAGEPSFYRPAAELSLERFVAQVEALGAEVDVVVVQVQSGTEETHRPSDRSLKALRAAVEAGADIVVGNQAHWVQAVEYGEDSFVAYALGNFIFDQIWTPEHTEGVLLEATLHGARLVNVRLRPYVIREQYRPEFVDGERAAKILGDVVDASAELAASGR